MSASTTNSQDCDFCRIAAGDVGDVEVVHEGEDWLAFFPLNPATPGHTLVIPRAHVANLWDVEAPLSDHLMAALIKVGRAIDRSISPEGMNLITSDGKVAEQTVFHLHFHLVPRWREDGFGHIWPTGHRYENAELGDVADRIRAAFG
jgi:histidine triad (HIT) family protein